MNIEDDATVEEQAHRWADVLRRWDSTPEDQREAYFAWVDASRTHRLRLLDELALREAMKLARPVASAESTQQPRIETLVAAGGHSANGAPFEVPHAQEHTGDHDALTEAILEATRKAPPRRTLELGWRATAIAAAVVLIGIAAVIGLSLRPTWAVESAPVREKAVTLADGSVLLLQTDSRIKSRLTADTRQVEMLAGVVDFDVRKETARSFEVFWSSGSLVVTGTRFRLSRDEQGGVSVLVKQGHVRVMTHAANAKAVEVGAGEGLVVSARGEVEPLRTTVLGGRLADVADAYNQHNPRPKFIVRGTACEKSFEASLFVDDPAGFILALENDPAIALRKVPDIAPPAMPDTVVIRERSDVRAQEGGTESDCARSVGRRDAQSRP